MPKEYAFYMDESGSPKPSPRDEAEYFAVGGVLIERQHKDLIYKAVCEFKERWDLQQDTPLHGNEIRSRKKHFAWLGSLSEEKENEFFDDLTRTITGCPILVHGCVVSREGYLNRYLDEYGVDTWEMMKSSFSILIERVGKIVAAQDAKVKIIFEKAGRKEDKLLVRYFNELKENGPPFNPSTSSKYAPLKSGQLQRCLSGIEGMTKANPILQLADLCLYPVARSKDQPENRAFRALDVAGKLVNSALKKDDVRHLGIKYYCFDNPI